MVILNKLVVVVVVLYSRRGLGKSAQRVLSTRLDPDCAKSKINISYL